LVGSPGASSADGLVTHFTSNLTAPDAPTAVHAVAASESADVVWSAPLDDGGMPITEYTVTSSPEGRMCYGSGSGSLQCALAGLTNGQTYTFTVTATNARGPSDPSAPSNAVTPQASVVGGGGDPSKDAPPAGSPPAAAPPAGGPGAPAGDRTAPTKPRAPFKAIKVKRTSITLTWGGATDNLGVAGYRVYEYLQGAWRQAGTTGPGQRTFTRGKLKHRTPHRFEVIAYDAAGNSSAPLVGGWVRTR
ncbi:MAG: fibronectin type III domain-containing protein, partial [Thermoleophilaceae bacterium]